MTSAGAVMHAWVARIAMATYVVVTVLLFAALFSA